MTAPNRPRRRPQFMLWILLAVIVAIVAALVGKDGAATTFGMNNRDLAQAGYFLVVLIFVGSALLGRGLGAGEIVRATAGWLAIFLLAIGAYAYRAELTGAGGRLLGALAPGMPIAGRLAGEGDTDVVVARGIDGSFAVRARVDDRPLLLMVDTGASFVTLTPEDARAAGIDTKGLRFTVPIRTANGPITAAQVTVASLAVGSIVRHDVPALVAPPKSLDQSLLGLSFLDSLKSYAIAGDRLVLTP